MRQVLLQFAVAPLLVTAFNVQWSRPKVLYDAVTKNYNGFANNFDDFYNAHRVVYFDACADSILVGKKNPSFRWEFTDLKSWPPLYNGTLLAQRKAQIANALAPQNTTACKLAWRAPRESKYSVRVIFREGEKTVAYQTLTVDVQDIWIAALGDSSVSGEGNPDVKAALLVLPKWLDVVCARSATGSYAYLAYQKVVDTYPEKGVLFTFLACSGASTDTGLLGPFKGKDAQIDVLKNIKSGLEEKCCLGCCKKVPDVTVLGIGGNDLKFSSVVGSFLIGVAESHYKQTPARLGELDKRLDLVNQEFKNLGMKSNSIYYVEYFDPLHNGNGELDSSCRKTGAADNEDFADVQKHVFLPLNNLMKRKAREFGWTFVDGVDELYRTHGICSQRSFIRTIDESLALQLNVNGAFHPTYDGHKGTSGILWRYIRPYIDWKLGVQTTTVRPTTRTTAALRTTRLLPAATKVPFAAGRTTVRG